MDKEKTPEPASPAPDAPGAVPSAPPAKEIGGKEIGGRDGLDPVRYGDWEKGGIAVDF
ncbi:DUF1674 domain-containing protein [Sandarakinorhabdus sp.]|uniref:DUF1674 domain-containing protein n=1 Tax=Sandarakinorhabdus sp. TaxID=1916663 RepID=UPI00286EA1F0|nr:DUF1674 domain-containing protein [Sandarakinorhabdus sp.]